MIKTMTKTSGVAYLLSLVAIPFGAAGAVAAMITGTILAVFLTVEINKCMGDK